eukprot:TRINITY_DN8020_c0_g1_i2.p1 TRINITY_DN8020_c0_g1~~TRINITY_DN8020_c0_g1_i2.p1  ORF type:complete len:541 (-),score=72.67 TRINITY_DN8020_c0_g1_i2:220-1842(-)
MADACARVPGLDFSQVPRIPEDMAFGGFASNKVPPGGLRVLSPVRQPPPLSRSNSTEKRPVQPRMPSNGVSECEAGNAAGADQVRTQYTPWVPVRKCAGHRPAPRVTRSEHRLVRNSTCPAAQTAVVSSSSSHVVSIATSGKVTLAANPCNNAKAVGMKAANPAPATVVRAATTTRTVAALDLAPQSCAPAASEPVSSEKTSKSRQTPRQTSSSKQPQPPSMPPPRPVPRRRTAAMLATADHVVMSRVLHRSPGGASVSKAPQRKPALETVEHSTSISLSCIEQLEEDSSSSEDEMFAKGLELGTSGRDGQPLALRTISAPALLVTGCLRGSRRGSSDERKNRHVSWRTPEESIIAVSPRPVDQARWACSLESTPLNASLLSGEDDLEDAANPPSIPPPPAACGESEIDVLKAALEVSLSLEPNQQESGSDDDEDLDPEDELADTSEIWVGVDCPRPRGQVGLPCVGLPCIGPSYHTGGVFVGDENDPGAANRPSSAPAAWPPKKPFGNALGGTSSPNLAATLRMPARSKFAAPLSLRET